MAHYKRRRPRIAPSRAYSAKALPRRLGDREDGRSWLCNHPRWWDKVQHTRPARHAETRLAREIVKGEDPDEVIWPVHRRPHIYYW